MKILKYLLILGFFSIVVGKVLSPAPKAVTAASLVQELNRQLTFPRDLGDGFRLDSITANGNDIVSTLTLLDMESGSGDAQLRSVLETASKSDTCREITSTRQQYVVAGIRFVKTYKDKNGAEVVSVTIDPRECA